MSCFLTDNFMKLLAKYLSTTSFCWTSSTFLADRSVTNGKDRPRQTDSSIFCSDWPDDRFVYLCSLCSACHNALTGQSPPCIFWQMSWLPTRMFSPTLYNREWSTTDVKTDIVFSSVRIPSFIPMPSIQSFGIFTGQMEGIQPHPRIWGHLHLPWEFKNHFWMTREMCKLFS